MGVTPVVPWRARMERQEDAMTKDPKEALVAVEVSASPLALRETSRAGAGKTEA